MKKCRWCKLMVNDAGHEDQCIEKLIPEERKGLKEGWIIRDPELLMEMI